MVPFRIMSFGGMRQLFWLAVVASGMIAAQFVALSHPAHAQGVVRDIRVEGNRRVEPETVRSYLQFSVGQPYDPGKVDASLQALFGTGLFADVSINQEGDTAVIYVVENPVINQIAFEGNSEVDTDTLKAEVQLKPRSVYTRARVQGDVQRILDVYRRQGRYAATVEPKIIELEQSRVNLVFEINEGGATKVQGINFTGNHAFTDNQLRDVISTTQSGWLDFLKGTAYYDPDRMNLDRELLRQFYLKNGYADVRVVAANAELDRDASGFYVNFAIDEGELYTFGSVTIENSLAGLDPNSLTGDILTHQGDTYNGGNIEKTTEKLTLVTAEQGFAFARVRPRAVPDPVARTISLTYLVDEGPRIYIERINVNGNTRTKDYVIRREFRLAEGDAYNPLLVDRAKKRLNALGFFKSVDIKRRPGSSQDRVILDVDLVEQSTGELSFGAGYSTSEGVIGDVSISERNLLGNGQFLRLRLAGSLERMQIDLSFTEPRFLDQNLSAGFDLFHKEIDMTKEAGYESTRTGGTVRLGFPLSEDLWMQTGYTLEYASLDVNEHSTNVSELVKLENDLRGDTLTSSIGTSLTFDRRNIPKNPTSGYYLQVATDMAGLGGDVQYVRVNAEGRFYYPISEKLTFVGRLTGGHIEGWGGDDIRLTDLYYRGGETIRGFDRGGFGPRDLASDDAVGGRTYWAGTAEVRFPLPFVPDDLGLSGAVFADAGSLWNANNLAKSINTCNAAIPGNCGAGQIDLVDDSTIRSSVGASIMWQSPVGPIRMDFAKALTKESYDEEQFFRFGASTKF